MTEKKAIEDQAPEVSVTLGSRRAFGNWKIFLRVGGMEAMPVVISKRNYRILKDLGLPEE